MFCVQLIETLADYDEEVAEHFLAEEEIDGALLKSGIRRATLSLEFSPGPHLNDPAAAPYPCHSPLPLLSVFLGSALKNFGIQTM
jgi:translation elongation factor EF-G